MTRLTLVHSAPAVDHAALDARAYRIIRRRPGLSYVALAAELHIAEADARAAAARLVAAGRVAAVGVQDA